MNNPTYFYYYNQCKGTSCVRLDWCDNIPARTHWSSVCLLC